ncbi:hypothetical protein Tco_1411893 [Tanacetum coccineum]
MSKHKSISKREGSQYHITEQDGLVERLKFISKGEKYQVSRGRAIKDDIPKKPTEPKKQKKQPSKKKKLQLQDEPSESEEDMNSQSCCYSRTFQCPHKAN